jgi:hypothetical protein
MHINQRSIVQKIKSWISGVISREIRGFDTKERSYMQANLKVDGPAWNIRKHQGLFSKMSTASAGVDWYLKFDPTALGDLGR